VCELEKKLQSRDSVLQRCREEARNIKALAKDKSLHSRQTLAKELEETKEHLAISDSENKVIPFLYQYQDPAAHY
jgi:hypothetical protein